MKKKPRVAIYYDTRFGRNDGSPLYYFEVLKKIFGSKNVLHLLPEGDVKRYGKFDYTFWVDWGEDGLPWTRWVPPKETSGKMIYVVSDAHLDETSYRYNFAKNFDYVFFNQKHYLDEYKNTPDSKITIDQKTFYLPHAAEPKAYPHFNIIKKYDLCFIGHMQEYHKGNGVNVTRLDALDRMFREFPNFYFGSRNPAFPSKNLFEDAAKRFCESRIVFNISIGNDVNMRFFETLVTGSFLLTNDIPELKNIEKYGFYEGVHYVSYKTMDEAVEKAKYYIEHDKEREKIARAGYKQALKTGTYKSRIQALLSLIEDNY